MTEHFCVGEPTHIKSHSLVAILVNIRIQVKACKSKHSEKGMTLAEVTCDQRAE